MTQPHYIDRELAAEICDRLEDLLSGNDQFHPVGCSEWDERARVAIDMAKDFIIRVPAPMEAVAWREKVAAIILAEKQAVADIAADYIANHAAMHIAERIQALAVIPIEGGEGRE